MNVLKVLPAIHKYIVPRTTSLLPIMLSSYHESSTYSMTAMQYPNVATPVKAADGDR